MLRVIRASFRSCYWQSRAPKVWTEPFIYGHVFNARALYFGGAAGIANKVSSTAALRFISVNVLVQLLKVSIAE